MKVIIINRSDATGGAAVVSRRLMHALRAQGVDARMLVAEKLTDDPHVSLAASPLALRRAFIAERLGIFLQNGLQRPTLFKIDTCADGVDVMKHPWMKDADAVLLNWVNQGMLSLRGIRKIAKAGIPVIWTMHDMWNLTGICHHAGTCTRYRKQCGVCPLMGKLASPHDLSHRTLLRKQKLYSEVSRMAGLKFVAVSSWLGDLAKGSTLLSQYDTEVIPNAFPISPDTAPSNQSHEDQRLNLLFGAARIDDPIKGYSLLVQSLLILRNRYPQLADKVTLRLFGDIRDTSLLQQLAVDYQHLGMIRSPQRIEQLYRQSHILLSTSQYETLPGTLVEAQAYGAIPVSTSRGGQRDIIEHGVTGWLVDIADQSTPGLAVVKEDATFAEITASAMADAIAEAATVALDPQARARMQARMRQSVEAKFSEQTVARQYIRLIQSLKKQ